MFRQTLTKSRAEFQQAGKEEIFSNIAARIAEKDRQIKELEEGEKAPQLPRSGTFASFQTAEIKRIEDEVKLIESTQVALRALAEQVLLGEEKTNYQDLASKIGGLTDEQLVLKKVYNLDSKSEWFPITSKVKPAPLSSASLFASKEVLIHKEQEFYTRLNICINAFEGKAHIMLKLRKLFELLKANDKNSYASCLKDAALNRTHIAYLQYIAKEEEASKLLEDMMECTLSRPPETEERKRAASYFVSLCPPSLSRRSISSW